MSESGTNQTRRERERLQRRSDILAAAERVFGLKGYHGATVESIAQEAGFATGTIYNFFAGKEDLYVQLVITLIEEFSALFGELATQPAPPQERIARLIALRLRHFESHRTFFRAFLDFAPGSRLDPVRALPHDCRAVYDRYLGTLADFFRLGVADGTFRAEDPLYLALTLEGVVNAFVTFWSYRDADEPLDTRIGHVTDLFLQTVRAPAPRQDADNPI